MREAREMDNVEDPITPLREAAGTLMELFEAYQEAGFDSDQALELVKVVLMTAVQGGNRP